MAAELACSPRVVVSSIDNASLITPLGITLATRADLGVKIRPGGFLRGVCAVDKPALAEIGAEPPSAHAFLSKAYSNMNKNVLPKSKDEPLVPAEDFLGFLMSVGLVGTATRPGPHNFFFCCSLCQYVLINPR